jgi:hypothetical protein
VSFVRAFGRFWYDFVIGDDWRIAAVVAVCLALGAVVAASAAAGARWIAPLMVAVLAAAFAFILAVEARRG